VPSSQQASFGLPRSQTKSWRAKAPQTSADLRIPVTSKNRPKRELGYRPTSDSCSIVTTTARNVRSSSQSIRSSAKASGLGIPPVRADPVGPSTPEDAAAGYFTDKSLARAVGIHPQPKVQPAAYHRSMGSYREERVAKNEVISRQLNEGIEAAYESEPQDAHLFFICECGLERCDRTLRLTKAEHEQVRSARQFVIFRNHLIPDVEQVVSDGDRFLLVTKREGTPGGGRHSGGSQDLGFQTMGSRAPRAPMPSRRHVDAVSHPNDLRVDDRQGFLGTTAAWQVVVLVAVRAGRPVRVPPQDRLAGLVARNPITVGALVGGEVEVLERLAVAEER
jgi:hypothetical protein